MTDHDNGIVFSIDKNFTYTYKDFGIFEKLFGYFSKDRSQRWKLRLNLRDADKLADLHIKRGFVAIMGESGAGKSTLISILSGFEKLSSEQKRMIVYHYDKGQTSYSSKNFKKIKKDGFGYIFQRCHESKPLSAIDNVALPLFIKRYSKKSVYEYCMNLFAYLNLDKKLTKAPANELSVGQLTRVGILRGIAQAPNVLFADEPQNNLDKENAIQILEALKWWKDETKGAVIMITHHIEHALKYADQIILLRFDKNENVSEIIYEKNKPAEGWDERDKREIYGRLKIEMPDKCKLPKLAEKKQLHICQNLFFLTKIAIKNITTKADASRTISIITLLGFLLVFFIYFSGNHMVSWFTKINELKNNSSYLRRIEILVSHPPGLSYEVEKAINELNAGMVAQWLRAKIVSEMSEITKCSTENGFLAPGEVLCKNGSLVLRKGLTDYWPLSIFYKRKALTCMMDSNKNLSISEILDTRDHRIIDALQEYSHYLSNTIQQSVLNEDINIRNMRSTEKRFYNLVRLVEFLADMWKIEDTIGIAVVYPMFESGPEFVKKNGERCNRTTTMRWLDANDPFFDDPGFKYIVNGDFRFQSNDDEGIIIDKETLVDVLGYSLKADEVKIFYGNGEQACIPVKAVVECMPHGGKYHVLTTPGFGEKIRSETHHCEDKKKFYQVKITNRTNHDFLTRWHSFNEKRNQDEYGNLIMNVTKLSENSFEISCDYGHAMTKFEWEEWIQNNLISLKNNFDLTFHHTWEVTEPRENPPPKEQGTVYTISKDAIRALGLFLTEAYRDNPQKKWRIYAHGYEDKIKFAQQSETILSSIESGMSKVFGALFLLFLSTNMLINIRNKAPEIAIFRAMGGSVLGILYIFNVQILIILGIAVCFALPLVCLVVPFARTIFANNVIYMIWKNMDEQREAMAAISGDKFFDNLLVIFHINRSVIACSILCVIVVVSVMVLWVRFHPQYGISQVLREK